MAMSQNEHFLFMQSILQFLKNNEFRIAVHTYSRSGSPLSNRNDLKPFCEGVNESAIHWDLITDFATESRIVMDGRVIYKDGRFVI